MLLEEIEGGEGEEGEVAREEAQEAADDWAEREWFAGDWD